LFGLDFLPDLVERRFVFFDLGDEIIFVFEGKAGVKVEETVGVGRDKVDVLAGDVEMRRDGFGNVFPPFLGGFGVVYPGAGEELNADILNRFVDFREAESPFGAEGGGETFPVLRGNVEDGAGREFRWAEMGFRPYSIVKVAFKRRVVGVMRFEKGMEFVPFGLIGN